MKILRLFAYFLLVCLTSCYFLPFSFSFLPGINTKMMLAAISLVLIGIQVSSQGSGKIDRSFLYLSIVALLVSLVAYATSVINNTIDYTYADYIISMWVWLGGAYTIISIIRLLHGQASIILAVNYLIAVCVLQCALALAIDNSPAFSAFITRSIADLGFIAMDRLDNAGRLYGIGCCLDVAGTRFAAVIILLSIITCKISNTIRSQYLWIYFAAFAIIVVIGNMISRTTTLGAIIALLIWITFAIFSNSSNSRSIVSQLSMILLIAVGLSIFVYYTNADYRSNIRFAFEGFFSLAEKGHWETNSNNMLKEMVIFPETLHTWIIGDGYLLNPFNTDMNYLGEDYGGFYKRTDIGYLRFVFYFGLLGLSIFSYYFIAVTKTLIKRFEEYKWLFLLLLALNFAIWFKVSTDIFLVFAVFLCIEQEENEQYEESLNLSEGE